MNIATLKIDLSQIGSLGGRVNSTRESLPPRLARADGRAPWIDEAWYIEKCFLSNTTLFPSHRASPVHIHPTRT